METAQHKNRGELHYSSNFINNMQNKKKESIPFFYSG